LAIGFSASTAIASEKRFELSEPAPLSVAPPLTTPKQSEPAPAVRFVNVSKRFQLNRQKQRTFVDLLLRLVGRGEEREYFWPLQDVSFEIPAGAVVGLIGENGAGKSTLLKLISRILQPTSGIVEIAGRVSALLELGAGFHPELTGRDNIHLHGSLLGLSQQQITAIVEPIVRFADLGSFIDTPVKHYSSGMYARLGFAIAVHVEPDILLVDEVLAVGDEAFQRRCLDAIEMMRSRGVTILLVSHSLSLVMDLCDRCIWLNDGSVRSQGRPQDVVRAYLRAVDEATAQRLIAENALRDWLADDPDGGAAGRPPRRWGKGPIRITGVEMIDEGGQPGWSFRPLEAVTVRVTYTATKPVQEPIFSILIHKPDGHYLWASNTLDHPVEPITQSGEGQLVVSIAGLALTAGRYRLSAAAYPEPDPPYWSHPSDYHEQLYEFQMASENEIHGDVVMPSRWSHRPPGQTVGETHAISGETAQVLR
jgi:ABC-type polysaccharide/polyol phosphate transport system ATPase subunit